MSHFKEQEVLIALEETYRKWADCRRQMVGTLYPDMVECRYLLPIRRKLIQLKYHPRYKHLDFQVAREAANRTRL